jgi:hypothetical protein
MRKEKEEEVITQWKITLRTKIRWIVCVMLNLNETKIAGGFERGFSTVAIHQED